MTDLETKTQTYLEKLAAFEQLKQELQDVKNELVMFMLNEEWQGLGVYKKEELVRLDGELFKVKCEFKETVKIDDKEDLIDYIEDCVADGAFTEWEKKTAFLKTVPDVTVARLRKLREHEPDSDLFDYVTFDVNPNPTVTVSVQDE